MGVLDNQQTLYTIALILSLILFNGLYTWWIVDNNVKRENLATIMIIIAGILFTIAIISSASGYHKVSAICFGFCLISYITLAIITQGKNTRIYNINFDETYGNDEQDEKHDEKHDDEQDEKHDDEQDEKHDDEQDEKHDDEYIEASVETTSSSSENSVLGMYTILCSILVTVIFLISELMFTGTSIDTPLGSGAVPEANSYTDLDNTI
jgi:hypothetical protein